MEKRDLLIKGYYESIKRIQFPEEIIEALPTPEFENFFELIKGLIKFLENDLMCMQEELKETPSEECEMVDYIEDEINTIKFKIIACKELLQKGIEDKQIEEDAEKTTTKNIIFATTDSGNVCIENDLKSFPQEYYDVVSQSLLSLQNGFRETNVEKGKQFRSSDSKISRTHEIIHFKVRVIYKILSSDTVYVLMAKMKKSTWDSKDRKEIVDRVSQRSDQYEKLKMEIKDPIKKAELIRENKIILDKLIGYININKR